MPRTDLKDMAGQVFGKWTVLGYDHAKDRNSFWLCRCECGTEKPVRGTDLRSSVSTQCKSCASRQSPTKHGGSSEDGNSPEYRIWIGMKQRCYNPNAAGFKDYGGRGIVVCDRWKDDYAAFLEDMGPRPDGLTIDRLDNDGDYEPGNCEWKTQTYQNRHTRRNRYLEHDGRRMIVKDWAEELGITSQALQARIADGWTMERILTTPKKGKNRQHVRLITHGGETLSFVEWARRIGIHVDSLRNRLKRMTLAQALDMPRQSVGRLPAAPAQ